MEEDKAREARALLEQYWEQGLFFVPLWSRAYPARLRQIPDPPLALYGRGRLPAAEHPAAAVIGTRSCSVYGRETARYFGTGLAAAGVDIVSGMARGIDSIAQAGALEAGGFSTAVLGCGPDICYPAENRYLYERLCREGCVLSEYRPGTKPEGRLFPPRNRIISGLSDLVLVCEARERSGTLITVDMALEQGREVYAVPGRIMDRCSDGCNRLIQNGAAPAVSVPQLLEGLGWRAEAGKEAARRERARKETAGKEAAEREIERKETAGGEAAGRNAAAARGAAAPGEAEASRPLSAALLSVLDWDPKSLDQLLLLLEQQDGSRPCIAELMQELVLLCMEGRAANQAGLYISREIL